MVTLIIDGVPDQSNIQGQTSMTDVICNHGYRNTKQ